jgi:guanylate kinase
VGKSSLIDRLATTDRGLRLSISVTTRAQRPGEVEGREYHFVDRARFELLRAGGALVEWAEVHGRLYGTPRDPLERWLADGYDVLLDIDYQGGIKIKESYPAAVLIFLLPPSWKDLEARLRGRQSEAEAEIEQRLRNAAAEIAAGDRYDYFVINTELERAYAQAAAIVEVERQRVARLAHGLASLLPDGPPAPAGR